MLYHPIIIFGHDIIDHYMPIYCILLLHINLNHHQLVLQWLDQKIHNISRRVDENVLILTSPFPPGIVGHFFKAFPPYAAGG